jgi:hypothetical protein
MPAPILGYPHEVVSVLMAAKILGIGAGRVRELHRQGRLVGWSVGHQLVLGRRSVEHLAQIGVNLAPTYQAEQLSFDFALVPERRQR